MGTLYLVATPIGNLEDITLRGLRVLREASLVAAEDTRQTHKLLERHGISARTMSYHEHNKLTRLADVLAALAEGDVALVSDAGTPGLNDPGYELVQAALQAGFAVSPVPGPSAPVAALVASGLPTDAFLFLGYLPRRRAERRQRLEEVQHLPYTLVFLETPHRLVEALQDLQDVLGDRPMAAGRELTKVHEEFVRGPISSLSEHFKGQEPRGEFTLVVGGASVQSETWDEKRLDAALRAGLLAGQKQSGLAGDLAEKAGWKKKDVYQRITELKNEVDGRN